MTYDELLDCGVPYMLPYMCFSQEVMVLHGFTTFYPMFTNLFFGIQLHFETKHLAKAVATFTAPTPGLLRLMRAFRVFRLFKRVESLRKIMQSLGKAVPGVANAFFIQVGLGSGVGVGDTPIA